MNNLATQKAEPASPLPCLIFSGMPQRHQPEVVVAAALALVRTSDCCRVRTFKKPKENRLLYYGNYMKFRSNRPQTLMIASPHPSSAPLTTNDELLASLRSRASTAAQGLHEVLSHVLVAFDQHSREIASLRQSLAALENRLRADAPALAPVIAPATAPEPKRIEPIFPLQAFSMAPPAVSPPSAPVAQPPREPSGPMMTQILWPSKEGLPNLPLTQDTAPKPVSRPISIIETLMQSTPPSHPLPRPITAPAQVPAPVPQQPVFHTAAEPMSMPLPSPVSSASVMTPPSVPVAAPPSHLHPTIHSPRSSSRPPWRNSTPHSPTPSLKSPAPQKDSDAAE